MTPTRFVHLAATANRLYALGDDGHVYVFDDGSRFRAQIEAAWKPLSAPGRVDRLCRSVHGTRDDGAIWAGARTPEEMSMLWPPPDAWGIAKHEECLSEAEIAALLRAAGGAAGYDEVDAALASAPDKGGE